MVGEAEKALRECLERVPFLSIKRIRREPRLGSASADIALRLKTPDGEQVVLVEVKSSGQPRVVREAVNQLLQYRSKVPEAYGVLVAPYISPQSARICVENGIGYVDLAGNCRLRFRQVYVEREGKPNPAPQRRDLRSLYSPRTTRVLRVLLLDPKKTWKLQPLAQEAGVSLGQVYNVKKLLVDREWIRTDEEGLRLVEPSPLLTEWSQNYTYRRNAARDFYSLDAPPEIESKLATACRDRSVQYALTGFSAAARLAPMVRYQRVTAYVSGDFGGLVKTLGLKEVPSGANVTVLSPYDDGVFYGAADINGIQIVSPVQAYLDLIGYRGRGEEAATFLLEQVIQRQW
ncbi:MAG: hypothetical protein A3H39_03305 [candidate division NC10 bacterium RIFCSPLOWO2_02_FULL_66_22]|nr:MAG: hypothetical protein A3H39_03305 [candidate division NC10 bacterium RIFCSPLOWO2_02_FULL_66_22]